jgi:ATP-dependent exoDNAse (exonuclease V) alpha subunit
MLNAARCGEDYVLGSLVKRNVEVNTYIDYGFDGTTIYTKNDSVERHNQARYEEVVGEEKTFPTQRFGTARSEWKHIPDGLRLKLGVKVMILANCYEDGPDGKELVYANGDTGTVMEMGERSIRVLLDRTQMLVNVKYIDRENVGLDKDGKEAVVGVVRYMPVRLSYAITVHKSQGLTLDKAQVVIDYMMTRPAMLYVAMSRVRTMEGLTLVTPGSGEGDGRITMVRKACNASGDVLRAGYLMV